MTTFPLNTVPPTNLVQILGKMGYREASRMRQTCRDIDHLIHSNKQHFKFPVERITFQFDLLEDDEIGELSWLNLFETNSLEHPTLCTSHDDDSPECALFASISVTCSDGSELTVVDSKPVFEYIAKTRMQCLQLHVMKKLANRINLVELYKACKASAVFVENHRFSNDPDDDEQVPLQLEIIKQLGNLKCPILMVELCEELPDEYAEILSQFQVVNITTFENDRSPSLAPLLKLMMTDLVFPLKTFQFPVYNDYMSTEEIEELQLEKWRLKQGRHVLPVGCFLIDAPNYYILLWQHGETYTEHCCGHRIPKFDIELLVCKWISHYQHLPIDVSNIYEYIQNNQDNYDGIKEQMEILLDKIYPTTTLPAVQLYYLC